MRLRLVLLLVAAAVAGAEPAWACTMPYRNPFADLAKAPGEDLIRQAKYIDWVEVEADGPPPCDPPKRLTPDEQEALEAAWDAWEAAPEPRPEPPGPTWPMGGPRTTEGQLTNTCSWAKGVTSISPLKARVLESIRGGGSPYFSLAYRWGADAPWTAYSDLRVWPEETVGYYRQRLERIAAEHRGPGYLDHGELTGLGDGLSTCGGNEAALVGERYLAFRAADGGVIALEPVRDRDDPWFDRVRRLAAPGASYPPPLDTAEFFRASKGVALVRLRTCRARLDGRRWEAKVDAKVLRGTFDAGPKADWVTVEISPNESDVKQRDDGPSFTWIAEYLTQIHASCRPGTLLLVMTGPFDRDGDSPPRAARVRGNRVRIADLLTGYELVGPQEIPVDQAFRWVSEGSAAAPPPK